MARPSNAKTVESLTHDEARRKNIPTAEYQSVLPTEQQQPKQIGYPRPDADKLGKEKSARNRDLDPQLVWRGKDEQDWSDLVVSAPPLYIQEKVHPKVLIDDLLRSTKERKHEAGQITADLFADFNGIPKGADKTDFYPVSYTHLDVYKRQNSSSTCIDGSPRISRTKTIAPA